jgi:hypothetical protein
MNDYPYYDGTEKAYPPTGENQSQTYDGPYQASQPFTGYPESSYPSGYYAPQQQQQAYYPPPQGMYMPPQPVYSGYIPAPAQTNGAGIASMVLGIVGVIVFWFWPLGLPISIVGLVLASVGMRRIEGKGFAVAGLVLTIISLVLSGCIAAASISAFTHMHY